EPTRMTNTTKKFERDSIVRGQQYFALPTNPVTGATNTRGIGCARCHGNNAQGGDVSYTDSQTNTQVQGHAPDLTVVFNTYVLAVILVMGALFGMVYLLMSMVLGSKLAYWVEACVTFGVLTIMSLIWFISALGPTGADTAWKAIALGPNLTEAKAFGTTYNVA